MDTQRLTLSQMAKRLNFSEKTFSKYVKQLRIPHFRIGVSMRFDPVEVESYFRVEPKPVATAKPRPRRPLNAPGRFAERLGL